MVPRRFPVALLAVLATFAATAVSAHPTSHEDPVRCYTNADLEPPDPMHLAAKPDHSATDDSRWELVADFIAREHERLDAERSHELNRRWVEIEEKKSADRRGWPGIGLASYHGYSFTHAHPYAPGVRRRASRTRATTSGPGRRIVPLHARPSLAQVQRSEALQRSGRDAFPSRSAPSR